jgi:hypothetical protein
VDRPTGRRAYLGNLRAVAQVFVAAASHSDSALGAHRWADGAHDA